MNRIRIILFFPISLAYSLVVRIRNLLFDVNILKSRQFYIPVIGIGNLSTGGTGKTPMAEYIIELLLAHGLKPAYLSRGYKRNTKGYLLASDATSAMELGDEAWQVFTKFGIDTAVCERRATGIKNLGRNLPDVILLDDAFQHRAVKASLSLLLTDFDHPYFSDFVLPSGNLREPRNGKTRADIIVVSKCPTDISQLQQEFFRKKIKPAKEQLLLFSSLNYGMLQPVSRDLNTSLQDTETSLRNLETSLRSRNERSNLSINKGADSFAPGRVRNDGDEVAMNDEHEKTKDMQAVIFCGIARPQPFVSFVSSRMKDCHFIQYPDHHNYSQRDVDKIIRDFNEIQDSNKMLVTTEKDISRIMGSGVIKSFNSLPLYFIPVKMFFPEGADVFNKNILDYVRKNKRNS